MDHVANASHVVQSNAPHVIAENDTSAGRAYSASCNKTAADEQWPSELSGFSAALSTG